MAKNTSKYIDPKYLPSNFTMVDPRNMKQEKIILFFENITKRQRSYSLEGTFEFKTANMGRKGNTTIEENVDRNAVNQSTDSDDDRNAALNADHHYPHHYPNRYRLPQYNSDHDPDQQVHDNPDRQQVYGPNATPIADHLNQAMPYSAPNPSPEYAETADTAHLQERPIVTQNITDDLIDPVLLAASAAAPALRTTVNTAPVPQPPALRTTLNTAAAPQPPALQTTVNTAPAPRPPASRTTVNTADNLALQEASKFLVTGRRERRARRRE